MKEPFTGKKDKVFDLNFFLVGNSGSGKTHLPGTYTLGPSHFYMVDKGGENTLEKLIAKRRSTDPQISVDLLSNEDITFTKLWKKLQDDEASGFFDYMRENNGICIFDSLTTINQMAIREIIRVNKRSKMPVGSPLDEKKGLRIQDWGQLLQWMQQFVGVIQDLPCATITTVHLHTLMNSKQELVARYPSVNGQFRQIVGVNYDETYLLEVRGGKHILNFKERHKFEAKSRVFSSKEAVNYNMNDLANAYMKGVTELPIIKR